jgi:DNA-binding transcriptional regulator YdaS (Cro superfamily)
MHLTPIEALEKLAMIHNQKRTAKNLGISEGYLSLLLNGQRNISALMAARIEANSKPAGLPEVNWPTAKLKVTNGQA